MLKKSLKKRSLLRCALSTTANNTLGTEFSGFKIDKITPFKEYNLKMIRLNHRTGASYVHIESQDENNVFGIGFKTLPKDDRGVPHILEHCVLCGSKKYPVNDPFMKMQNKSLSSYMNAMTASDWTFYPFRTQNRQDFFNLMGIYLDAVFFPNLSQADFHREGWHVYKDKQGNNQIGGVVFNEMKGVYSDSDRLIEHKLIKSLMPSTIYSHDSGGMPLSVPGLTLDDLKTFHKQFYSAGNAFFYSFGNLPLRETAKFIDNNALKHLDNTSAANDISAESRRIKAELCEVKVPPEPVIIDPARQSKAAIGYICAKKSDIQLNFNLKILSKLLLSGQHTTLYRELIEKGVGSDFLSLSGFSDRLNQSYFCIGLEGVSKETADYFSDILEKALHKTKEVGFTKERIDSILHSVELSDRHVSSNLGLDIGISLAGYHAHKIAPENILKVSDRLASLRQTLTESPNYFADLLDRFLLQNFHKSKIVSVSDIEFASRNAQKEQKIAKSFGKNLLREMSSILSQKRNEDDSVLPALSADKDVSEKIKKINLKVREIKGKFLYESIQPTNGVGYITLAFDIKKSVPKHLRPYLTLFASCLGHFGAGGKSSRDFNQIVDNNTGGISAKCEVISRLDDNEGYDELFVVSTYALEKNLSEMCAILNDLLSESDYNDPDRISQMVGQILSELNNSLLNDGLNFAKTLATAGQTSSAKSKELHFGLTQIEILKKVHKSRNFKLIASKFEDIAQCFKNGFDKAFVCGTEKIIETVNNELGRFSGDFSSNSAKKVPPVATDSETVEKQLIVTEMIDKMSEKISSMRPGKVLISLPLQCNFVAVTVPTVPYTHKDYPALMVLSNLLQWEHLHKSIREQGNAYGSGASQSEGIFWLYSYRDPNCLGTLEHIASSIRWASYGTSDKTRSAPFETKDVKSAILACFSALDRPVSPNNKGFLQFISGLTHDQREKTRRGLLKVDRTAVVHVAMKYLGPHADWLEGKVSAEDYEKSTTKAKIGRASVAVAGMPALEQLENRGSEWQVIKDFK